MKHFLLFIIFLSNFLFLIPNRGFAQLEFIENKGQWPSKYKLRAKLSHGDFWLSGNEVAFVFSDFGASESTHGHPHGKGDLHAARDHCYTMTFVGASSRGALKGESQKPGYHNYFISSDSKKWASKVSLFEKARTKNLYEGIDLDWRTENSVLKYEFTVKAGSDPSKIKTKYAGIEKMEIVNGALILQTSLGKVTEQKPVSFQFENGKKKMVESRFKYLGNQTIGFEFPNGYDKKKELIIDPILVFSSFSGSRSDNWGYSATPGENGTTYACGIALGPRFPVTTGAFQVGYQGDTTFPGVQYSTYDIGVLKFNANGTQLLYATYLGGTESEIPSSTVVDKDGNLIILGATGSANFPVSAGAYDGTFNGGTAVSPFGEAESTVRFRQGSDIIISKLSPDGTQLLGSTFLGGSDNEGVMELPNPTTNTLVRNYGDCYRGEILVDSLGKIYIASNTRSSNFPTVSPIQSQKGAGFDGICAVFNPNLTALNFSTFIGGDNNDGAYSLQLGKQGFIYLCGGTASSNFPTSANTLHPTYSGSLDGFVCKFSPAIGISSFKSSYVGTTAYDQSYFIQLDKKERVYLFGQTKGAYPVSSGVYSNPNSGQFIHCISPGFDTTYFSTVFGNGVRTTNISPTAFLVDDCGRIYCSGWGGSINNFGGYVNGNTSGMPTSPDALIRNSDGSDFYILVLEKNATSLGFATFFGDSSSTGSEHVDGGTSRFDKKGVIYQAVCAGCGGSSLFPTTPGVVSNVNGSTSCNNAVFKYDFSLLKAKYQPSVFQGCAPISIRFNSESIFAQNYIWDFQDGPRVNTTQDTISHLFDSAGTYKVKLIALNADACPNIDSLERTIRIEKAPVFSGDTLLFCSFQDTLQLPTLPSGSLTYNWSPSIFLSGTTVSAPKVIRPDSTLNYTGSVKTGFGCISTAQFRISDGVLKANSEADTLQGCRPLTINFSNKSYKAKKSTWFWGTGDSTESNLPVQSFTFNQAGVYKVVLKVENDTSCNKTDFDTLTIRVFDLPVLNDTTLLFCQTGSFQLKPGPNSGKKFSWTPSIGLNDSTLSQPTVSNISPRIFSLAIKDSNQCAAKATIKIKDGILFAKAKADTLKGCKPLIVSFENNSYRSVESTWFWGNGDSTVTNSGSLNYEFQQAGDFKVVLRAKNDTSCNKIAFDTLVVQVLDLPVFSDTILKYCQNGSFNLKAAKNNGKSFLWTPATGLNDPTLANPTLTNPEPRIFSLAIIDSNQCRSSANVVLKDGRLKSDFAAGVFLACAPVSLILNNLSTNPQRSIWLWDGDSVEVEGNAIVPIVLNRSGNYEIKLKVRSDSACQKEDVSSRFLVIGGIPEFPKNTTRFCPGDSITLSVSSSPGYQYQWPIFAKPFSSDSSKAKLLVIDSLRFEVNVSDSLNCPGKQEFELIPSKPKANFDAVSKFEICIDRLNYDFKANLLNGASYEWKIADSEFNGPVVSYTFSKRGTYPVQMIVKQQSCKDTLLKNLEVKDAALVLEPNFEFIPRLLGCDQLPRLEVKNLSIGAEKSVWSWNGNSVFQPEPQVVIREPQTLEMNLLVYNGLCSRSLTKSISIEPLLTPNLLTVNGDGFNQNLKIKNLPAGSRMSIKNRWGQEIFSSDNYQNDWSPPSDFTTGFYLLVLPNGEFCNNWLQVVR